MSVPPGENQERGVAPGSDAAPEFDPYRFGAPEHPVPAEYAPPGYRGPVAAREPAVPPYPPPPRAGAQPGYGDPAGRAASGGTGKAITAMVLGIVSILLCWLTIFDVVPIVLAVVFGLIALNDARRDPDRGGRGMAIAGVVCAGVAVVLVIVATVFFLNITRDCSGIDSNSGALQQCIRDHL